MSKFWEIKQSAIPKTVEIYIYSEVVADGYDWWTGETITSETSANFFRDTLAQCGDLDNINIYINSLGGSVVEGVSIYNQLKRHKAYKTVYIDGFACSIASVIAMAGDKIIMPKNTTMVIHNAWTHACGNAKELRKQADDLDIISESSRQAYLLKAGPKLSEDKLIEMLDNETYLTAMKCVEYGLADEYADVEANIEQAKQMLQQAKQSGMKQYATKLDKLVALAKDFKPTPPPPVVPPDDEALKQKTANTLSMCLNALLQSTAQSNK